MKFITVVAARLQEASTYAGLSALCVAVSTALSQDGTARYIALFGAVATGVGAVAKAEHDPELADAMDQAAKFVPVLISTVKSVEELLPDGAGRTASRAASKTTPGMP